jgi:type IV pilus assembly protein PilA
VLQTLRKRLGRDEEEGFTLIELMVVVLIIAILIAIAIPTFLGARTRAQDRQAQSNLRNAFAAEKVVYTDNQAYTTATATLSAIEPSLTYAGTANDVTAATDAKTIYTNVTTGTLVLGAKSKSGTCFYMKDSANAPTTFASSSSCPDLPTSLTFTSAW